MNTSSSSLFRHSCFVIRHSPAFQLFTLALLLRLAVFSAASIHYQIPLQTYAEKGDGQSYLHYAQAILGDPKNLTEYDRRVFPGYPAMIALFHLFGFSFPLAAVVIDWLSAAIAAGAAYGLFGEKRIGWAMLFLLPHYLANSSLAMSEAPLLAFTLLGLLLSLRNRPLVGGLLLGFAGLIRPMACFPAIALLIALAINRQWRQSIFNALAAGGIFLAGLLALHLFTGDVFRGVKIYRNSPQAYEGHLFQWPFHSLIFTPLRELFSPGFIAYIYIHVALVLLGCTLLACRIFNRSALPNPLDVIAFIWLICNTLFQLCIGSHWGFLHFPRFAIPAQPALFYALAPHAPRSRWIWCAGIVGVFWLAVVSVRDCP